MSVTVYTIFEKSGYAFNGEMCGHVGCRVIAHYRRKWAADPVKIRQQQGSKKFTVFEYPDDYETIILDYIKEYIKRLTSIQAK
jgi:DNA-binding transcriptional regulator of glucitol operon